MTSSRLVLRLFGSPQVELSSAPVRIERRKSLGLLAYLADRNAPQTRDALATLLWPELDASRAYATLRLSLWELNKALGEGWLRAGPGGVVELVRSEPGREVWADTTRFEDLALPHGAIRPSTSDLEEAAALYRADFLSGLALRDSPDFETWQLERAEELRRQAAGVFASLVAAYRAQEGWENAIASARRWLSLDPLNESVHRELICLYSLAGQRTAALRQYETCARQLKEELGVEPEPETQALYEQARSGKIAPDRQGAAPVPTGSAAPAPPLPETPARLVIHLPAPATPFVGREVELADVIRMLSAQPDCRLLTLLGPGGIGKTRLAIQAVQGIGAPLPQTGAKPLFREIFFIPLAGISSADGLDAAVASALNIPIRLPAGGTTPQAVRDQLLEYLDDRSCLLVLDNFEHLLAGADLLSQILETAPGIRLLVTSRVRLNLPEEWVYTVRGLPVSDAVSGAPGLFIQLSQRVQTVFTPGESELDAIRRICRILDGMPLGIVLASTWMRLLSPGEIADEMEHSLDFLTSAQRGVPQRHQSLRGVFTYSWALLTETEQAVFRRLAVFQGGFTRAAAAQVAGAALGVLSALVDKSLLYRGADGRYDLHEVLKQFAAEQLEAVPEEKERTRVAYAEFFLGQLTERGDALKSCGQHEALLELNSETQNLMAAWLMALDLCLWPEIQQAWMALHIFLSMSGRFSEGQMLFQQAWRQAEAARRLRPQDEDTLSLERILPSPEALERLEVILEANYTLFQYQSFWDEGTRQRTRYSLERVLALPSSYDRSLALLILNFGAETHPKEAYVRLFSESVPVFEAAGDTWALAFAFFARASTAMWGEHDHPLALQAFTRALELFTGLCSDWNRAMCLNGLARLAYWSGDYETARHLGEQAVEIYAGLDDIWRLTDGRFLLGQIAADEGRYAEARDHFQFNLDFLERMGRLPQAGAALSSLGYVEFMLGNLDRAEQLYRQAQALSQREFNPPSYAMILANLGDVACARGQPESARDLYQETLGIVGPLQDAWPMHKCLKGLAVIAQEAGDLQQAGDLLRQALGCAWSINRVADTLDVLGLWADLLAARGQTAQAAALLDPVLAHPALSVAGRAKAQQVRARLSEPLSATSFSAAELEAAVSAILKDDKL